MAKRKIFYILLLLFAIWLVGDSSFNVLSALKQHEPSYRIFRSLLEVNLMLFCAAFSIWLWTTTMGVDTIRLLFFQPLLGHEHYYYYWNTATSSRGDNPGGNNVEEEYEGEAGDENTDMDDSKIDNNDVVMGTLEHRHDPKNKIGDDGLLHQSEFLDANYDEDGEVDPRQSGSEDDKDDGSIPFVTAVEITHVALNMLVSILVTLFLFTLSSYREEDTTTPAVGQVDEENENPQDADNNTFWKIYSRIAAPTFPLLLFLYNLYAAFFPWKKSRRPFWIIVSYTLNAPWFPATFRDGFLGDVLTSSVRPLKDISFTIFYILFGLKGWWSTNEYRNFDFLGSADANVPDMERSWIVHTVVLPICSASPLWWRFLQNLRQVYDERQRWPYLGNALKYFFAAQVAMFGVFHPEKKHNIVWLTSFVLATLYQCWWDIYMDWNLIDGKGALRSQRLYKSKALYCSIAIVNMVLRFCWTLSFLPLHYLDSSGILTGNLAGNVASQILAPVIGTAEIIRRTLWGLLRFEWEAIKTNRKIQNEEEENIFLDDGDSRDEGSGVELQPMAVRGSRDRDTFNVSLDSFPATRKKAQALCSSDMSSMNSVQVIGELGLYATIFGIFCVAVAAHRGTY